MGIIRRDHEEVDRKNRAEAAFEKRALRNGWFVTKRGWPDFICELPDGRVIAVEVKPAKPDGQQKVLKVSQVKVMEWLTELGVRCFVSDGETLEPFDPKRHRPRTVRRHYPPRSGPSRAGGLGGSVRKPEPFVFVA